MSKYATPEPKAERIDSIIKYIQEGDYRIPCFQRDFVWDKKKAAALLDSILKGYPIGAIILWKTKEKLAENKSLGGKNIPARKESLETYYVIDGQQRLTSLYLTLVAGADNSGSDFSTICLCLDDEITNVLPDIPKGADSSKYIYLQKLFGNDYLEGISVEHLQKVAKLNKMLCNYYISTVEINDNYNMGEIVDIFERLNIGGKPLTLFNIISAKTYEPKTATNPGFDLSECHKTLSKKYASDFGTISESTLLKTISLCLTNRCNKADILAKLKKEDVISNYTNIEKAFEKSVVFCMDKLGVRSSSLLPYDSQIAIIAYFFFKVGKHIVTTFQEQYIIDYFWRTTVSGRFNAQAESKLNADVSKFISILNGVTPEQESIVFSPKYIIENGTFKTGSAFVKGMLCLMASNSPKSLSPGKTILIDKNILSSSLAKQYHHFFPMKSDIILNNPAYDANNVVNIVLMDAATNNDIKNDNPSKYFKKYQSINSNLSADLETHFIVDMDDIILEDNFTSFIDVRSNLLYNEVLSRLQNVKSTVKNNDVHELMSTSEIQKLNPTAGTIIHDHISRLIQSGRVPKHEVDLLTDLQYCKKQFSHPTDKHTLSYPILIEKPSNKSMKDVGYRSKHWRYYSDIIIDIYGKEYMISSQVYGDNINEFLKWYKKYYK